VRLHPDVYEPAEDTHLLLRALREREPDVHGRSCADVGTGTGAVAMALAASGARVVAVDVSPLAVRLAAENLEAQGPGCRGRVLRGHLLSALRGPFDVVTFNAPYLPSAPGERVPGWLDRAFHGGEGGVEVSEAFVRDLPRVLAPGGRAYLVVSSRADLERLAATAREAGLRHDPVGSARFFFEEVAVWRLERG
jgi:release factor glutamine methyltransferase